MKTVVLSSFFWLIFGFFAGCIFSHKYYKEKVLANRRMSDKHLEMFLLMNRWFWNKRDGKKTSDYLREKGYQSVIIYGMGYIGECLYSELKDDGVDIKYLVDNGKQMNRDGNKIYSLSEQMNGADVVIVTPIYYFEELEEKLSLKFESTILSIADIIYRL